MSLVSRRPRVKSISSAVLEASAISCVEAIGTMVSNLIGTLDAESRAVWTETSQRLPARRLPVILPLSALQVQMPTVRAGIRQEVASHGLSAVDSARLNVLMTLQVTPFACEPVALRNPMERLAEARTETEVNKASGHLIEAAEQGHRRLMNQALITACKNASVQSGFTSVDTRQGLDGCTRVIASDASGRALVTEIRTDQKQEPFLETEVVGVTDGSCAQIMDQFDRALEEQGVRTTVPLRKPTGGVCELAAAKELLKKLQLKSPTKQEDRVRLRKLNQQSKVPLR